MGERPPMRCFRCALDFGPDDQFCDRCGRGLSRPPGTKTDGGGNMLSLQDNQFQYSTHSPPRGAETFAPPVAPDTTPLGLIDSPPRQGATKRPGSEPEAGVGRTQVAVDLGDDPDEPRSGPPLLIGAEPVHESPANRALPPALLDFSLERGRRRARLPVPLPVLGGIALAAVLLASAALVRRDGYNTDLEAAASLASQGQYAPAIDRYGRASGEWPFHDAAAAGQATVVAQATAIATLRAGQVAVYAALQHSRAQVAEQYESYIAATATTVTGNQQAQSTALAQDTRATATAVAVAAQAWATAVAERTGIHAADTQRRVLAGRHADVATSHATAEATAISGIRQAMAEAHRTAIARHRAPLALPSTPSATPTIVPSAPAVAASAPIAVTTVPDGASSGRSIVYAAIGASEAVGVGADNPATQSWVADLSRLLPNGSRLVNMGKAGALLDYGLQTELPAVVASNPDVVTVWMVVNDINQRISPAAYQGELDALLTTLQQKTHAKVFVGNVPDLTKLPVYKAIDPAQLIATAQTFNTIIAQIARAHGATVVDLYTLTAQTLPAHPEYISGDGFHPSTAGYADLASTWWVNIRPHLPL